MNRPVQIIDLFAGPGGLGEGFSAAGRNGRRAAEIRLSVEKDPFAIATLRLRACLRTFGADLPKAYYDAINKGTPPPDLSESHPSAWAHALSEARQLELGAEGVFEELCETLDDSREQTGGNTVLIGGPPCQAYSLAGRSRNAGIEGYVPEMDGRHFLYREYVRILDRLRPAAFVMENVKGILSSTVNGSGIFNRIVEDLCGAGDGYVLLPLATERPFDDHCAKDFVVRAEEFGVPQARHRVILVGLRSDIARGRQAEEPLLSRRSARDVTSAISGLVRLRSGLSRKDNQCRWQAEVRNQADRILSASEVDARIRKQIAHALHTLPSRRVGGSEPPVWGQDDLSEWYHDPQLFVAPQHEARGHMPKDLGRYLFVSAFGVVHGRSPKISDFPSFLKPAHANRDSGDFADRFRVQLADRPASTVTSHISKDGHYFIHPDVSQCRSLTVREAARLQTFPDNYWFCGGRTEQYKQVGNAVPPYLARQIGEAVLRLID